MEIVYVKKEYKGKEYLNFYVLLENGQAIAIDPHKYGEKGSTFVQLKLIAKEMKA